jgi:aminomethyltransferase
VFEAIMEAGQEFGIVPTGPSDIRRIEGAIFNWGADMTYENNPIEMGLDRLVAWDLPDHASISLAALRRIRETGVDRRINGVEFDGAPFPELNNVKWTAAEGGEPFGKVTSAIHSPRLGKNIGYCWLPAARSVEGASFSVGTEWGTRTATVVPMPFVDPDKTIPVS